MSLFQGTSAETTMFLPVDDRILGHGQQCIAVVVKNAHGGLEVARVHAVCSCWSKGVDHVLSKAKWNSFRFRKMVFAVLVPQSKRLIIKFGTKLVCLSNSLVRQLENVHKVGLSAKGHHGSHPR